MTFFAKYKELKNDFCRNSNLSIGNKDDKPFACPVPGCKKRYKNVNGIKYHSKNGHKNDGKYVSYVRVNHFNSRNFELIN